MKNVNNEDSQKEKPTRHRREKVVLTDEQINAVIKDFQRGLNDYDHSGRNSDNKSKPSTSAQRALKSKMSHTVEDFDVDSINLNIIGMDDDSSNTKVADVVKVNDDVSTSSDGLAEIKERVLSQKAKMDKTWPDNGTMPENDSSADKSTYATISTDMTTMAYTNIVNEVTEANDMEIEPAKEEKSEEDRETPTPPQPSAHKVSRISSKMRKATRDEFHDAYLVKTETKGGSPITIAPDILKFAYRVCSLSGDHRARPTYLINNLLRSIFKGLEADIKEWSKID